MSNRLFVFTGGTSGPWRVISARTLAGEGLQEVGRLHVRGADESPPAGASQWSLQGITSNERYVERAEKEQLVARQEGLARPEASCAALIPIRKSAAWWALTQDERRHILEEQSHHIRIGLEYLPAIARRLHHCRDLTQPEPFDFLTWFEFAPEHGNAFDLLLERLRASPEWQYVDREVDIRLTRDMA
ncbi:chlorite dismutase family protein [Uliginosibacterium sp. H3]|uniref:Chlorite dismutase family protein n=1 Tax=Uliginosibacterium silvisoli TaxID=3114758 RepID=A0ABU6K7U6_9RHOO|nr:chlorite dismutase family protein [Uliginosibacterium sp. H3]